MQLTLTTAIDYPNSPPHVGTAYEKVIADIQRRASALWGKPTTLLMGLDENTVKVVKRAKALGKDVRDYTDMMAEKFRECWYLLDVQPDVFVRTSSPEHHKIVKSFIAKVMDNSPKAIFRGEYEGPYCEGCEEFKRPGTKSCLEHPGQELKHVKEPCWMFDMPAYANQVRNALERNRIWVNPRTRLNESLTLLQNATPLCISRSGLDWGVPFPGDESSRVYVWFDALLSYLHATGDCPEFHLIGKDINRFHTNLWPAMLFAAGKNLPHEIIVHGFITSKGVKESKSNDAEDISHVVRRLGSEAIRYYYASACDMSKDTDFSDELVIERYNTDLADKFGNLVSRLAKLIYVHFPTGITLKDFQRPTLASLYNQGAASVCKLCRSELDLGNLRMEKDAPWSAIKQGHAEEVEETLRWVAKKLLNVMIALYPVLPVIRQHAFETFGIDVETFNGNQLQVHRVFPWFMKK